MRPHRRQPARLPRPWDSPGKNTGVGCHFLLQCMKVKSESEVTQSCPTLSDPMDRSLQGSSIHGIFQARVLEWGAIAFSVISSNLLQKNTCLIACTPPLPKSYIYWPSPQLFGRVSQRYLRCSFPVYSPHFSPNKSLTHVVHFAPNKTIHAVTSPPPPVNLYLSVDKKQGHLSNG